MITNDNGLLIEDGRCVGYLMHFEGKGVYDPNKGKRDITPEDAKKHNELLAQGEILGLDKCEIGQWGTFYLKALTGIWQVQTWTGALVSADVVKNGRVIIFRRNGRVYRGIEQKEADCFNFKRVK
jgi:hypothetical protein